MSHQFRSVLILILLFVITFSGGVYAQEQALPQEELMGSTLCAAAKQSLLQRSGTMRAGKNTSAASDNFDAGYYHLDLHIQFDPDYIYGETRIQGRVVGSPMVSLKLDFSSTMIVDRVQAENGSLLTFSHEEDVLTIPWPAALDVGTEVLVDVVYHGKPDQKGWGTFVFGRLANNDPYVWSLSQPYGAREWWPSKDHPSDKADSVRVSVTVPTGMQVGSNGLLVSTVDHFDGTTTFNWFSRYPIASYLVSLAAGKYDQYDQTYIRPDSLVSLWGDLALPVLHLVYEETLAFEGESDAGGWKHVIDVLPVLEYWFGPYPFPEEKYGHAHVTFGGGMEHQTMSSMGRSSIGLITHELAHMWFGDKVTLRYWPHLWLNEGFATYAELIYWQHTAELYPGTYNQIFSTYYDRARSASGTLIVEDTTTVDHLFQHARVYSKGGMVLHMLRGILGDDVFREVLQTYASDEVVRYGTAVTDDFQRVAEAVSGLDLDSFFRQWVTEGTGYPNYEVEWDYRPVTRGYEVIITVNQTQEEPRSSIPVFTMPITLDIQSDLDGQRFTVINNQRNQTYVLEVIHPPNNVVFDPEMFILRNRNLQVARNDEMPALPLLTEITSSYPNPTNQELTVDFMLAKTGAVQLTLYDVTGRLLQQLYEGHLPGGSHTLRVSLDNVTPGMYFLSLSDTDLKDTQPVVILEEP